jgi:hypothetical protein
MASAAQLLNPRGGLCNNMLDVGHTGNGLADHLGAALGGQAGVLADARHAGRVGGDALDSLGHLGSRGARITDAASLLSSAASDQAVRRRAGDSRKLLSTASGARGRENR